MRLLFSPSLIHWLVGALSRNEERIRAGRWAARSETEKEEAERERKEMEKKAREEVERARIREEERLREDPHESEILQQVR